MPPKPAELLSILEVWRDKTGKNAQLMNDWFPTVRFPESIQLLLGCKSSTTVVKKIFEFYNMANSQSTVETRNKLIQVPPYHNARKVFV